MSIRQTPLVALIALAAGFCGGLSAGYLHSDRQPPAKTPSILRAARFEVVDGAGNVQAVLGVERDTSAYSTPRLILVGRNGKQRLLATLDPANDKPYISLSDDKREGRVLLGITFADAGGADWDEYALSFNSPENDDTPDLAIVARRSYELPRRRFGTFFAVRENGTQWAAPPRLQPSPRTR